MSGFIAWLENLSARDTRVRAVLRRSLGFEPGRFVQAFPYVEPFIRDDEGAWRRKVHYLVAGLWAAHWKEGRQQRPMKLGQACAEYQKTSGSTSVERRFIAFLDSDCDQLPHRLRQMIALLKDQALDFDDLLRRLLFWNDEVKSPRIAMARHYYRRLTPADELQSENEKEQTDENPD
jgi:CRISPR system Cascade subunit CasB